MSQKKQNFGLIILTCLVFSCSNESVNDAALIPAQNMETLTVQSPVKDGLATTDVRQRVNQYQVVDYAETLLGVPYKYASSDPNVGFDCSGFITNVFNHFGIDVPRSSVDFTDLGKEIPLKEAKRGDLILFTGTDNSIREVGHMGIVTDNNDTLHFIHATSGKQYSVTITPLNEYYMQRFVKITRL